MRTVYINGEFTSEAHAKISVFDRGFLFADAVYEGIAVINGQFIDFPAHIARLERSCRELNLPLNHSYDELLELNRQIVKRNNLKEGFIYLQISRGVADRDFAFDNQAMTQSIVIFCQVKPILKNPIANTGMSVVSVEDKRWSRCDIKTVQLVYPSLAKMEAIKKGAHDAWFVKDGTVIEGTSNNAFIITHDDVIITHKLSNSILPGITRAAILNYVNDAGIEFKEHPFPLEEAYNAKEAFISSASTFILPVIRIDGHRIGTGKVGPMTTRLRELYIEESLKRAV